VPIDCSRPCRTINGLWRPIAPPPRQTVLHALTLKTHGRFGELRSVKVGERSDVEDCVATPFDGAGYDWHHSARHTDVEIRRVRCELVTRYPCVISYLQMELTLRAGRPRGAVFGAKGAVADAGRNGALRIGPFQCETDVAAMAASVNDPSGNRIGHDEAS
jgi:hypothetical protein